MNVRKFLSLSVFALPLFLAYFVSAAHAAKVYTDNNALALGGYDAVSYQDSDGPKMGNPEYAYDWNGVKWLFVSKSNQEIFAQQPEKYAPQYGGYCAFAVSKNSLAPGDPNVWTIVDGKLYLNLSKAVQSRWESDRQNLIQQADKNWPDLSK